MTGNFIYPVGLPIAVSLVAYNSFLTGLMTLFKRRDEVGIRYLIFSFLVFLWGIGVSFMLHNELPDSTSQFWGRFSQMCALLIPPAWLHFVFVYIKKRELNWVLLKLAYVVAFLIIPLSFSDFFIQGFRPMIQARRYPIPGPLYIVFTILFCICVSYSFWILYKAWKFEGDTARGTNYKWLLLAQVYGFVAGGLSFLPVYGIPLPQYNLLAMPLWQVLLAYAIVRHRLMDYEEVFVQLAHRDKLAAIGTIATSINHEIRNPLYIIHGMAESFLENFRGENQNLVTVKQESVAVLERTAQQAKRAMEIMGQLSLFAKQKIADTAIDSELANLSACLENVLPLIRHEMALEKIRFEKELPENLPALKANPRQLEEVLFNLIVNACQAMKPRGGVIRLSAKQITDKVLIQIEDNGPGIPQNRIKQIFEPFYTTKEEGTGLGLYITRQLVEKNGGKITTASHEGMGTLFCLEFEA